MLSGYSTEIPVVALCLDVDYGVVARTPLGQFTAVSTNVDGIGTLLRKLNNVLDTPLASDQVSASLRQSWPAFAARIAQLPKAPTRPFELVFWGRAGTFSLQDTPIDDGPFSEEMYRIVSSIGERAGIERSEVDRFRCLDLVSERWIEMPVLLSNIRTDRLALIDPIVLAEYEDTVDQPQSVARAVAFLLKQTLDVTPLQVRAHALLVREMTALAERQQKFYAVNGRHGALQELNFYPAPGASIEIAGAGAGGWSAVVTHERLLDYYAFRVGDGGGQFADAEERTLVKLVRQ
jgi:hypothetical protein